MVRKRKSGAVSRRYQPRTTECQHCHLQHKNLLIFGISTAEERLKKCSQFEKVEGISNLKTILSQSTKPQDLYFILPALQISPEPAIVDVIIEKLGNVSIFTSNTQVDSKFFRHCRHYGSKCYILENLTPVISQIETQITHLETDEVNTAKAQLDVYNARWNQDGNTSTKAKIPTVHRQIDLLWGEICKRDFYSNTIYHVLKSSLDPE